MPKRSPPPAPGIRPGAASFGRAIDLFPRCFERADELLLVISVTLVL